MRNEELTTVVRVQTAVVEVNGARREERRLDTDAHPKVFLERVNLAVLRYHDACGRGTAAIGPAHRQ